MPTIGCGHWNGRRNRLPHLVDQSFGEVGGAGGFACRWKLISIAHPNPENGYAPAALDCFVTLRTPRGSRPPKLWLKIRTAPRSPLRPERPPPSGTPPNIRIAWPRFPPRKN